MVVLRVLGFLMIAVGLLFTITVIGAFIGVPMMLIGLLFVLVGKKRAPIIIHVQNNQPQISQTDNKV